MGYGRDTEVSAIELVTHYTTLGYRPSEVFDVVLDFTKYIDVPRNAHGMWRFVNAELSTLDRVIQRRLSPMPEAEFLLRTAAIHALVTDRMNTMGATVWDVIVTLEYDGRKVDEFSDVLERVDTFLRCTVHDVWIMMSTSGVTVNGQEVSFTKAIDEALELLARRAVDRQPVQPF